MPAIKSELAFEEGVEGNPDVLFRVRGKTECGLWMTFWYGDCQAAIEKEEKLKGNGATEVSFKKYEMV